jgi:hypothetical protein
MVRPTYDYEITVHHGYLYENDRFLGYSVEYR